MIICKLHGVYHFRPTNTTRFHISNYHWVMGDSTDIYEHRVGIILSSNWEELL
jgi:hypothetical protein